MIESALCFPCTLLLLIQDDSFSVEHESGVAVNSSATEFILVVFSMTIANV